MNKTVVALGALSLALATPACAEDVQARITYYGLFESKGDTGPIPLEPGATVLGPVIGLKDPKFYKRTDHIEARLCVQFGIQYEVTGVPPPGPARLTIRVTHPEMVRPDGERGTVESWTSLRPNGPSFTGFTFSEPYELVAGTWTSTVLYEGRVLAEQKFEVELGPVPLAGCGAVVS